MRGQAFVWDAARAMFQWAADPDRGRLLSDGFRNPFLRRAGGPDRAAAPDPFGEPDVTMAMACDLLRAADEYQLRLFAPMVLYGLRAAEPAFLFHEHVENDWLSVPCIPELAYTTEGKRAKRLPLFEPLATLLRGAATAGVDASPAPVGLLFLRRDVAVGAERAPLVGAPLPRLAAELSRRVAAETRTCDAVRRHRLRDAVLRDAGGTNYDRIEAEFRGLAARLGWPRCATLKDLRHLFSTALSNAGIPEPYRQFLMGHAPSGAVISRYTHLNQVREHYLSALGREFAPVVEVLESRSAGRARTPAATQ